MAKEQATARWPFTRSRIDGMVKFLDRQIEISRPRDGGIGRDSAIDIRHIIQQLTRERDALHHVAASVVLAYGAAPTGQTGPVYRDILWRLAQQANTVIEDIGVG